MEKKTMFAQNLAKFRSEKKISQVKMAQLLSEKLNSPISNTSISHWEKGDFVPSVDVIFAYCDILGVSANDIYGIDDTPNDKPQPLSATEHLKHAMSILDIDEEDFDKLTKEELEIILQNTKSLVISFINRK